MKRPAVRSQLPRWRDAANRVRYGQQAPRFAERIWFDPAMCRTAVAGMGSFYAGLVVGGDWDRAAVPIDTVAKIHYCRLHWSAGLSWEDAGAYDHMKRLLREKGRVDRCSDLDDVVRRYVELDRIFEEVRAARRLQIRLDADAPHREQGGVLIHIDRECRPIHAVAGSHRLAICQVLGLSIMPAQVGVVHPAAFAALEGTLLGGRSRPNRRIGS